MAPRDFYAIIEGYENKQKEEQELLRIQTFILVSPYMQKGAGGYNAFKKSFPLRHDERTDPVEPKMMSAEEINKIKANHSKYLVKAKKNGSR